MIAELYLNGHRIDIENDIPLPVTYSLNEIENPTERNSAVSKTIEVVGTQNNDRVFGEIYMIDQYIIDFNPLEKAMAQIIRNGVETFRGIGQLLSIRKTKSLVVYELGLYGESADFIRSVSTKELTDIDFSDLNHEWNSTNVYDSWVVAGTGNGYCYPLIDYGQLPAGERTNTPPASQLYTTEMFYPGIYLKTYVDRIFSGAGFTYVSDFLNSEMFAKLVVPYGLAGLPLMPEQLLFQQMFFVGLDGGVQDITQGTTIQINFGIDTPEPFFNGGNYDTANFEFDCVTTDQYDFECHMNWQPNLSILGYDQTAIAQLFVNGASVGTLASYTWAPNTGNAVQVSGVLTGISLTAGDVVDVRVNFYLDTATPPPISYLRIFTDGSFWLNKISGTPTMAVGQVWDMNQTIVPKIKQSDFMAWVFKMFNCFVMPDKYDSKKLYIEPFPDFYATTEPPIDWTQKLDIEQTMTIEPVALATQKTFVFNHRDGGEFIAKKYQTAFNSSYGSRIYEIENEFATDTNEQTNLFAIAPMSGYTSSSRLISRIWDMDENGIVKPINPGLRIMFHGFIEYPKNAGFFVFEGTPLASFPYAGHLDNLYNPEYDLCFGIPREIYWTNNTETNQFWKYTNGNLFNRYWRNYVDELTNVDAKRLVANINLDSIDIYNLDFRKLILIGNTMFRLISIRDFDANKNTSTTCEFIRVTNIETFVATQFTLTNGANAFIGDEPKPYTIIE
jgi:hypothetical protein